MKKVDATYSFCCDRCGLTAGADHNESKALEAARAVARTQGWLWCHPGWGLLCPECQKERKQCCA